METTHPDDGSPQWQRFVSAADKEALADALSDHALVELGALLCGCDAVEVRGQLVAQVLRAAPQFGDRAVIVALARVAYTNDPDGNGEPEKPR